MSNYKIIADEQEFDKFVEFLPTLKESECYYVQIFGRKKYLEAGTIQSGQQSIGRFVCRKEELKYKLLQFEIPLGRYKNRDVELPQECIVTYICPNPKCHEKAAKNLLVTLANKIVKKYEWYNTHQLALTELHRAKSRNCFVDFDFDDIKYPVLKEKIDSILNPGSYAVIDTRGGFHLLIMPEKVNNDKNWYTMITGLGADVKGDTLSPIPGTYQGNHIPRLII